MSKTNALLRCPRCRQPMFAHNTKAKRSAGGAVIALCSTCKSYMAVMPDEPAAALLLMDPVVRYPKRSVNKTKLLQEGAI